MNKDKKPTRLVKNINLKKGTVNDKFKKPFITYATPRKDNSNLLDIKIIKAIKHSLYQKGKMHFGFKL